MNSVSTISAPDHAGFACRRVIVFAEEANHPLMRRVQTGIREQLAKSGLVEDSGPPEQPSPLPQGGRGPDWFVRLKLTKLEESGILSGTTRAVIEASLGNAPWLGAEEEPARFLVESTWVGTLDVKSTFKGFRTDHYASLAQDIAKAFSKSISNQLQTLATEHTALPALPSTFYGPYEPAEPLEFLQAAKPSLACTYYGLLTHNDTFWSVSTGAAPADQLRRWLQEATQAGWQRKESFSSEAATNSIYLRRGDARLEIFRERRANLVGESPAERGSASRFIVHYRKQLGQAERDGLAASLLSSDVPVATLLSFERLFSPDQRQGLYARLRAAPFLPAGACITLAEDDLLGGNTNAAEKMLLRAMALASVAEEPRKLNSRIEAVFKRFKTQHESQPELTPEACRAAGFIELTNGVFRLEIQLPLAQPLLVFSQTGEDRVEAAAYELRAGAGGEFHWSLTQSSHANQLRTSGTTSLANLWPAEHNLTLCGREFRLAIAPETNGNALKFSITEDM